MSSVLLVPPLPSEHGVSFDRYALRLVSGLRTEATDIDFDVAGTIDALTSTDDRIIRDVLDGGFVERRSHRTLLSERRKLPGFHGRVNRFLDRAINRHRTYPRRVRGSDAGLVHILTNWHGHLVNTVGSRACVVTVHDMGLLRQQPMGIRESLRRRRHTWLLNQIRHADGWIVATEWLKAELAQWLGHQETIHVIPFGVDSQFFSQPRDNRLALRRAIGIPETAFVVLHVGKPLRRKNVETVIAVVERLRASGLDAWLLQVGADLTPQLRAEILASNLQQYVRSLGLTTEDMLRKSYQAADALLFPSLYEGFGFPVVEAMASSLPVVHSGAGGLKEVSGQGAVVVEDGLVDSYAIALLRIAEDPHWRADLIGRGLQRAAQFRWEDTARLTAAVYRDLAT